MIAPVRRSLVHVAWDKFSATWRTFAVGEIEARPQLWANLPKLRPMIEALAGGSFAGSDPEQQLVLALVITTELRFRDFEAKGPETCPWQPGDSTSHSE
jgi:hypothetical protein